MIRSLTGVPIWWVWLCLLATPACAATIFHWTFDGPAGTALLAASDQQTGKFVTSFNDVQLAVGATNSIRHGHSNPWINPNGTSAEFLNTAGVNDPGVGLFRNDAGVNEPLDLSSLSSVTIEAFVYPFDLRQAVIVRKTSGSASGWFLDLRPAGHFGFRLSNTEVVVTTAPITANEWYHLALVKDGVAGQARFYLNGTLRTNVALAGNLPDTPNGIGIGSIVRDNANPPGNSGQFFYGRIDEVRISNMALSPGEFLLNGASGDPPQSLVTIRKSEAFDTAVSAASHGWVDLGTRLNNQDYGFSNSAHAGGSAGEAGGSMARRAVRSSYCDVFGGRLTLDHSFGASGKLVVTSFTASGNASVLYGHGDSTQVAQESEANQIGLVLATTPPSLFAHLTFSDGYRYEVSLMSGLVTNQIYVWNYSYDPTANGGHGRLTVNVSAVGSGVTNTGVRDLNASLRARDASFDSFGITSRALSDASPVPVSIAFIDNVEYTAITNSPGVQFEISATSALETAGEAAVQVVLSEPLAATVTVDFTITGGTATGSGVDYRLADGTLVFPPGVTNQFIPISLMRDGLNEPDETIELSLFNPVGAGMGMRAKHVFTIFNVNRLSLTITNVGEDLVIHWPAHFWDYHLQYRPDVVQPPPWKDVTNTVGVSDGWRQAIVKHSEQRGFFRLAQTTGPLPSFTNSVGMRMVQLPAGAYTRGYWQSTRLPVEILNVSRWVREYGDYDEKPAHEVTISRPFWIGAYEVSNAEYEQFDPDHSLLRGKFGFSSSDNEAVVFVSWHEAASFCEWLSAREGRPYRLPTEAEWEYACRAGTMAHFSTGGTLPAQYLNNPGFSWWPDSGSATAIHRGLTPPNAWELYDLHGNVEEWCHDWYGPYDAAPQVDPVGRAGGMAKVSRGGSHSTVAFYLRSENRSGAPPEDKSWYIGFRVVMAELPATAPLPEPLPALFQTDVNQTVPPEVENGPDPTTPYFNGPWKFTKVPGGAFGPLFSTHNHVPAIAECPNGDLLAFWYTCVTEQGRELALAATRLRHGDTNWQDASPLYDMPDRNDHGTALWFDGEQTLYHFNGLSAAATWGPLALTLRTSTNNGVNWSPLRIIAPEHKTRQMPIASFIKTTDGSLMLACDAVTGGSGGSVVWISRDGGQTWFEPGAGRPTPTFTQGTTGAWLAGIHAPIAELSNGNIIAFGRGNDINSRMPKSVSSDGGTNWAYSASLFPPVGSGQRPTILRLKEGPLFFASFGTGLTFTNTSNGTFTGSGLFTAVSFDDGVTWPYLRLVSDDGPGRSVETTDGSLFAMSHTNAEPRGYLTSTQARNGIIHLISSRQHYQFNLKWLTTRPPSTLVTP